MISRFFKPAFNTNIISFKNIVTKKKRKCKKNFVWLSGLINVSKNRIDIDKRQKIIIIPSLTVVRS